MRDTTRVATRTLSDACAVSDAQSLMHSLCPLKFMRDVTNVAAPHAPTSWHDTSTRVASPVTPESGCPMCSQLAHVIAQGGNALRTFHCRCNRLHRLQPFHLTLYLSACLLALLVGTEQRWVLGRAMW